MPLRDHFVPPISKRHSWEGFFGGWPAMMVMRLVEHLPLEFAAEPRVHLGEYIEGNDGLFPDDEPPDAKRGDEYAYEVRVFDRRRLRRLVAAVKFVSPANKDCRASRRALVTRCASLLRKGVYVSIVDIVTVRGFNLYSELLALIEQSDPAFSVNPPPVYSVTCRARNVDGVGRFESWAYPLAVGQPLPDLPIWLSADRSVRLELEASYEDTCRVLRVE